MNKKCFFVFITTFLIANGGSAQPTQNSDTLKYSFSSITASYVELTNPIVVTTNNDWYNKQYAIPIGFPFTIYHKNTDSLFLNRIFGFESVTERLVDDNQDYAYSNAIFMYPIEAEIVDRGFGTNNSLSSISYQLEGTAGNRILKVQWKNVGFEGEYDSLGTLNYFINYQLWLYEKTNIIEYHYGPNKIDNAQIAYYGDDIPDVGFHFLRIISVLENKSDIRANLLAGNPNSPYMQIEDGFDFPEERLDGTPANGIVYRFVPINGSVGITQKTKNSLAIYPNPASTELYIQANTNEPIQILSFSGTLLKEYTNMPQGLQRIDISNLEKGMYIIKKGIAYQKLIKH